MAARKSTTTKIKLCTGLMSDTNYMFAKLEKSREAK
jgi:hypothetical protein